VTLCYLPVSNAESVQHYTGHSNERHSSKAVTSALRGLHSVRAQKSHHQIQHRQRSLAQQRATFSPAKTIATTRAPNRPSTHTPCKAQLTLQELAELPCWLGSHDFALGGVGSITSRPLVIKVLLLHLVGLT
jgi:hypothetical protein